MSRSRWTSRMVLVASLLGSFGCATVLVGPSQTVSIRSSPPGATATVLPGETTVVTPAEIDLPRKRSHTVCFHLDGYRPVNGYIDPLPGGWMYGNLVLGGLVGMLIDIESGAAWTLSPDPLEVVLEPMPATEP